MRTSVKFLSAAAVAGVVAAISSVFTAGSMVANPAVPFVGGSVAHNVVGTTVTSAGSRGHVP